MAFIPGSPKFSSVRTLKKKIVKIRTADVAFLKHFYRPRDRPIFMRPISYDLSCLLSTPGLFVDPNDKDDDLPDQYLFNESNIDFNDKDEPFEGPKNHTDAANCDQPYHNSNDQTRTIDLTHTSIIITDNNKFKKSLYLETKCPICSQMISNEEIAEHANACAEAKFEESANSKEEKEQPSEDLQTFQNLADQQKSLSSKFMMSSDESVKFVIRRNNVVDNFMRKMNMFFKTSVIIPIRVEFVGEEAIDDGAFLSFQKVSCDWFVARISRTTLFL